MVRGHKINKKFFFEKFHHLSEWLLEKDISYFVHHRNIQGFPNELFKETKNRWRFQWV